MEAIIKEKISADHLLYVSLKYTKTCDVIINLLSRWKNMIEKGMDRLVEKAKKAKKTKRVRRSRKQVRVAFVGAGGRARRAHYPSLAANPDAKIVAVSDLDEERLQTVTEEYGIPGRYTDYKQMIEKEKPDVVYAIMSPQYLYDVAATVLEMGRNLVVEKPPAINSEQTRQLAILARKNKALTGA